MSPRPTVSILIPCRDAARWIRATVDSALAQTHPDIEVIVFDDGSSDRSPEILGEFADARLRVLRGPGEGGNFARNKLLAAASGEWVQYLDADDCLLPGKTSRQLAEAGDDVHSADALLSPVLEETWRDNLPTDRVAGPLSAETDLLALWFSWRFPQTGGPLWRASALRRIGGWNESMPCCQDNELAMRALQANLRWSICPTAGAVYRIWSDDTLCRRDVPRVLRVRDELTVSMLDWLRARGQLTEERELAAGQAFFEMARTLAKTDPACAADYYHERRRRFLVCARGSAAPLAYRTMLALGGFAFAEKIARFRRGPRS
ncbi:MAG: glycosyltransferase [Verrucomicrobiota bacterium]